MPQDENYHHGIVTRARGNKKSRSYYTLRLSIMLTVYRLLLLFCGRPRNLYGLGKPKRSRREKAEMPFRAKRRHEIWTTSPFC